MKAGRGRRAAGGGEAGLVLPRTHRSSRPRGRPRTDEPIPPALAEFLEALGNMAADAVLAKYREAKELSPVSIKSPRAFYRTPGDPGDGETGGKFDPDSSGVHGDGRAGS